MKQELVVAFLRGGTMIAELGIAIFFFRYWKETGDRLFMFFAAAFFILSISQLAIVLLEGGESEPYAYFLRLGAFLLIIFAIIEKNLPRSAPKSDKE